MTTKTIVIPKGEFCDDLLICDLLYILYGGGASCIAHNKTVEEDAGYYKKCQQCLDKTEVNIEYQKEEMHLPVYDIIV